MKKNVSLLDYNTFLEKTVGSLYMGVSHRYLLRLGTYVLFELRRRSSRKTRAERVDQFLCFKKSFFLLEVKAEAVLVPYFNFHVLFYPPKKKAFDSGKPIKKKVVGLYLEQNGLQSLFFELLKASVNCRVFGEVVNLSLQHLFRKFRFTEDADWNSDFFFAEGTP